MPQTLTAAMAREIMKPLPQGVTPQVLASDALELMQREGFDFLPVVARDTEKFLGVVLRRAVEFGCANMGHDVRECLVLHHLKADVDFCLVDEAAEEVLNQSGDEDLSAVGLRGTRARTRLSLPVIVVDERKVPVGMLERISE